MAREIRYTGCNVKVLVVPAERALVIEDGDTTHIVALSDENAATIGNDLKAEREGAKS
jgi:hypothetical protein